ncbi:hypothetical protein WISP_129517 [Willisornis vidua]|uniref:Uncharacterized protein n=1 Tax=Willisornis vidua TaxID=1566151 RepID=A0ABQ9CT56_9PASS|nr:hypothetical protein WISP_129517 [Willisornis vidua]
MAMRRKHCLIHSMAELHVPNISNVHNGQRASGESEEIERYAQCWIKNLNIWVQFFPQTSYVGHIGYDWLSPWYLYQLYHMANVKARRDAGVILGCMRGVLMLDLTTGGLGDVLSPKVMVPRLQSKALEDKRGKKIVFKLYRNDQSGKKNS